MANLYELTNVFKVAEDMFNRAEDDLELAEAENYLIEAEADLVEKVENIAKLIKNFEAERDAFKKEAARLSDKSKSYQKKVDSLKQYLESSLEIANVDKVKGDIFTVSMQNNPMSLNINSTDHIPSEFKRTPEPVVDKRELLKHIKTTGEVFDGVEIRQTRSVRIR